MKEIEDNFAALTVFDSTLVWPVAASLPRLTSTSSVPETDAVLVSFMSRWVPASPCGS